MGAARALERNLTRSRALYRSCLCPNSRTNTIAICVILELAGTLADRPSFVYITWNRYRSPYKLAFQPCPGIAQVAIGVSIPDSDVAENVLHVYKGSSAAWTATELTALVNGIDTWITTGDGAGHTFVGQMSSSCVVSSIQSRDLTTAAGPEVTKTVSHAGTDATARVASGLSFAITLRSGLAGRSNRGRIYMIGLPSAAFDGTDKNLINASSAGSYLQCFNSLIAAVAALNAAWSWVVLSRSTAGGKRVNGVAIPITAVGYSDLWVDYQRRRSPAHARHR